MMTPFGILLIAHLVGDYLFQTSWMAMNKATRWIPLLAHVTVYTGIVTLIAWISFGGLPLPAIIFIFVTHLILDRRGFVTWWVENIMTAKGKEAKWLMIVVDQIFHLIVLAICVLYLL